MGIATKRECCAENSNSATYSATQSAQTLEFASESLAERSGWGRSETTTGKNSRITMITISQNEHTPSPESWHLFSFDVRIYGEMQCSCQFEFLARNERDKDNSCGNLPHNEVLKTIVKETKTCPISKSSFALSC
jgi:hypothetical protein